MVQLSLGSKRPRLPQQVAQAYLDDLAASPRNGDRPLPLSRLSDFARRNGSSEVSMTLAELFTAEGTSLLTVLDPRFHPELSSLSIRILSARNQEEGATYDLVQGGAHASGSSAAGEGAAMDAGSSFPWEREGMTSKDWVVLLRDLGKRKTKLDPPPRDNPRGRESYLVLRELLLEESAARKAFLTVAWKGRPSGPVLLSQLLSKGQWVPEVDTDCDYLEAELDHIEEALADRKHEEGHWALGHGWTVVREVAKGERTYRAAAKSGD